MVNKKHNISDELLAAYMDGNTTLEETQMVLDAVAENAELRELMQLSIKVDEELKGKELCLKPSTIRTLPMLKRAAKNTVDNLCAIKCEGYALRSLGIDVSDEMLEQEAKKHNWLREDGMPLHNMGFLSGLYNSYTTRRFYRSLDDIAKALKAGKVTITVIDNTELNLLPLQARRQDIKSGYNPNHAIVIKSLDLKAKIIELFDPGSSDTPKTYPLDIFSEAWNDSANYLVTITNHANYEPQPQNLSDVKLEEELIELREAIAENAHEIWAQAHKQEGWTYGPKRDDEMKIDPNMRPYPLLPESVKKDYRRMAISTIKLVKKSGWDLVKRK